MYELRHNPYFSRWFSAITLGRKKAQLPQVTILILVDGFLQYIEGLGVIEISFVTILILVDGFMQLRIIELLNSY